MPRRGYHGHSVDGGTPVPVRRAASFAAGVLLALGSLALAAGGRAEDRPPADELIARLAAAPAPERPRLAHDLARAGAEALEPTRKARDAAVDQGLKGAYAHAAAWQLAFKVLPVLTAGFETNLTYDGQFADLKAGGPEVVDALFALAEDAATEGSVRLAALRAVADVAAPARGAAPAAPDPAAANGGTAPAGGGPVLSHLRRLYHEVLL